MSILMKHFVGELSKLYQTFASASALESIVLKAATVLSCKNQKKSSKAKEHAACLERRLRSWKEGNLNNLLLEGRAIDGRLPLIFTSKYAENIARSFTD